MKERIVRFLSTENKTSAQFAEEIGVQPSGVSHIISGRNNPSLDFVIKMLKRYNYLSPEWLLFGKEPMYRSNINPTLFDDLPSSGGSAADEQSVTGNSDDSAVRASFQIEPGKIPAEPGRESEKGETLRLRTAERIVIFYSDGTFVDYEPGKK